MWSATQLNTPPAAVSTDSYDYHEPSIAATLTLVSFLYLLNVFGWLAQLVLSAGLLGQLFIGIVYGSPLAGWLDPATEAAFVTLGYVGLLLIVFEGGMQSSVAQLAAILPLAICVAITGIIAPIGLSFILMPMGFPALHAFAAGSSLASTSLGTVLSVLHPAVIGFDLRRTRLGAALLVPAIMDDIVAFILAKVLSTVGSGNSSGEVLGKNIGRTIGVTLGIGLLWALMTRFALRPLYRLRYRWKRLSTESFLLFVNSVFFIGLVAGAGYAGTSPLYGVYVAGLSVAYLCDQREVKDLNAGDTFVQHPDAVCLSISPAEGQTQSNPSFGHSASQAHDPPINNCEPTLISAFETYISPILNRLLLPVFFGSIGYSIPFVPLWRGQIIWRGIAYSALMTVGKLLCGLWLVFWQSGRKTWKAGAFVGIAMVARGEIGLLIAQIARHTTSPLLSSYEFLVVIWAVLVCTVIGPVTLGALLKRWKRTVLEGGWE